MAERNDRKQPNWQKPVTTGDGVRLKLYNSLTRKKEEFAPQENKRISWYSCGPTVYDSAHMGHARCYVSFDIIRRILKNYFGYKVVYVMNITDIDDKIIQRARQHYLFSHYVEQDYPLSNIISDINKSLKKLETKIEKEEDIDKKKMYIQRKNKVLLSLESVNTTNENGEDKLALLDACKDALVDWLDERDGMNVTDNSIFEKLARFYENDYHDDMLNLNVLPPDVLTRVTEYIPEVIDYIIKIIDNGYGYESNSSVYFDTTKFSQSEGHFYAKLSPESYGDNKALADGEGALSTSENEKRCGNDFALWKASKPGEPFWDSPWGKGRPGWHIECSAMASSILGESMDIHSGGVDLKFPHHDNEMAQSEAYFDNDNWIRYFLHSGHLHIEGCKMSKSLKNFVSIKDALKQYTSRQIRFLFLIHSWKDTLNYGEETMREALIYEKSFSEFFLNIKDWLRKTSQSGQSYLKWSSDELELQKSYLDITDEIHVALCDSVDTKSSMDCLRNLVSSTNIYLDNKRKCNMFPDQLLIKEIAVYITDMLKVFGVINLPTFIGFANDDALHEGNVEDTLMPHLNLWASFRDDIRAIARKEKLGEILSICDSMRDERLPSLGVRLEDYEGVDTTIKLVDKETLLKEIEDKKILEEKKRKEKEARQAAKLQEDERKKMPPNELFLNGPYSQFDDRGIPTHDNNGKEISKSQLKKLTKTYESQLKKYNDYLASLN